LVISAIAVSTAFSVAALVFVALPIFAVVVMRRVTLTFASGPGEPIGVAAVGIGLGGLVPVAVVKTSFLGAVVAWASCVQVAVVFGPPRGVGVVE
jgi:hypothetical protein